MLKTESKLEFEVLKPHINGIPVIVVAAGSSTRMGKNKMLISLLDMPLLIRTLKVFEGCKSISNIILVARESELLKYSQLCEKYMISKVSDIIKGGSNRQESVLLGLKQLKKTDEKVLIHDGARPLVSDEIINRVINGLEGFSAVTPVVKVKDTIKQIGTDGVVLKTLCRDALVQVQTPQGVDVRKYFEAINGKDLSLFTDDVSIFEAANEPVLTVLGDYKNIKVTTKEDIIIAEAFLKGEAFE